jgi:N-acetylglucosaminyl-diphospho-decaprenol L-rhamnosyltransferase
MSRTASPAGVPRVHAVVVHHRGPQILARCLETLLASPGVELHVAVVANACLEPLPEVAERDPRVVVLRSETPLGFGAANNRGASRLRERAGRPEYLYFLNDDTASEPGALAALVEHMKGTSSCAIAGPRLMIEGADGIVNSLGLDVAVTGEAWDEGLGRALEECGPFAGVRPALAVTGTALLVREDVFGRLGGWREIFHFFYEDVDLCLRARDLGGEVEVVTGAVVHHAVSATAGRDSDFTRYHILRNRLLLIALHWPPRLLVRTAPRVVAFELGRFLVRLARGRWGLARLQARAWGSFLRLLPAAARLRGGEGPRPRWTSLLKPPGAVPARRLPGPGAPA